jgi:hypothetical protein
LIELEFFVETLVPLIRLQPLSDLTGDFRYGGFDVLPSDGIRHRVFGTPAW